MEEFYERVLADPDLTPCFTGTNAAELRNQQVQFLTQALGGPAVYSGPPMGPVHEYLPPEDRTYAQVAKHLEATLRSLRISKDLAEEVVALVAPLLAEIVNRDTNPATPPKGEAAMATTSLGTGKLSKGTSRVHRNVSEDTEASANRALESVDRDEIYDLIPGLVVVMDTDHTILDLNETAARTAGKPREECVGAKFWDLYDNPPCHAGTCAAAEAVRTGKLCEAEAKPIVQGKEVAVLITAAPRFDQAGRVVGVVELIFPAASDIGLADDINRLADAAREGQLNARVDESKFNGRHLGRAKAVNAMLDALIAPPNVAAKNWRTPSFSCRQVATSRLNRGSGRQPMINLNEIKITPRDQQVLRLLVQGCSNKEIASQLSISPFTVKQHLRTLFLRAGIKEGRKRVQLATAMFIKEQVQPCHPVIG